MAAPPLDLDVAAGDAKHALISNALAEHIRQGRYPVGSHLPSEQELATAFGVSRFTVRSALRSLHDAGLILTQQGLRSTIVAQKQSVTYTQAFDSAADLLQYAARTKLEVLAREEIVVDATLAEWLGCKPGEQWWKLSTIRSSGRGHNRIAFSEIYVPLALGAALRDAGRSQEPVFAAIEKRTGQPILEIRQDITATRMPTKAARHLRVRGDEPALQIVRRYFGPRGRILEVSRSFHPYDKFSYSMRVRLSAAQRSARARNPKN